MQKCVKEQTANFDKQEQQIIEKKFLQIAKDKMSYIITLKGVTRDALTQENWDKAFQDLSTARTAIVELSEVLFIITQLNNLVFTHHRTPTQSCLFA